MPRLVVLRVELECSTLRLCAVSDSAAAAAAAELVRVSWLASCPTLVGLPRPADSGMRLCFAGVLQYSRGSSARVCYSRAAAVSSRLLLSDREPVGAG
jgi:hypothetical protein